MIWFLCGLFVLCSSSLVLHIYLWRLRVGVKKTVVWHLQIHTIDTKHKLTVLDDEYNALKTWLRGEGDSLFEMATDDAYLGLRRAHVVSVKGERS